MVPLGFLIFFSNKLSLAKIRTLVVRDKVNCNLFMVRSGLLLILLNTSFYDYIHKILHVSFFVNFMSLLDKKKLTMIIDAYSFLFVQNNEKFIKT